MPTYTDEKYVDAYFSWRKIADEAFDRGDGAASCGAAARADRVAAMFRDGQGLASQDAAVARLRQLRGARS